MRKTACILCLMGLANFAEPRASAQVKQSPADEFNQMEKSLGEGEWKSRAGATHPCRIVVKKGNAHGIKSLMVDVYVPGQSGEQKVQSTEFLPSHDFLFMSFNSQDYFEATIRQNLYDDGLNEATFMMSFGYFIRQGKLVEARAESALEVPGDPPNDDNEYLCDGLDRVK